MHRSYATHSTQCSSQTSSSYSLLGWNCRIMLGKPQIKGPLINFDFPSCEIQGVAHAIRGVSRGDANSLAYHVFLYNVPGFSDIRVRFSSSTDSCRDLPQEATHTWWMSAFAPAVIIIGITLSSWFGGRKYGLSCLVFKVSQRGGAVIYTVFHPVNIWSNASVRRQMLPGAVPPCLLPSKTNKVQMNG